eukprot:NODE_229_length_13800_cov_0.838114.p3 type:complete len:478 gc:universal NODE_229_length_13800_cov_0.838114:1205-2638(+)
MIFQQATSDFESRPFMSLSSKSKMEEVSASSTSDADEEYKIQTELFSLIESGNRQKVRDFLENDDGIAAQVILTALDPNIDKKYHYDDDVEMEANELLGSSVVNLNAIQIAIFSGDEDMALDILNYVEKQSVKLGSKMVLLAFLGMMWGNGNTTLHLASFHGITPLVRKLLELGASPTKKNQKKYTAIDCCADQETSKLFTDPTILSNLTTEKLKETLSNEDLFKDLRTRNRSNSNPVNVNYGTLRKGVSLQTLQPKEKRKSAIHVKKCITKKTVRFHYEAVLLEACRDGDLELAKMLIENKNISVNYNELGKEQTPLHLACAEGHLELVKYLLKKGADVNARDFESWTPLHCAAANHQIEIIKILTKEPKISVHVFTGDDESLIDVMDDEDDDFEKKKKQVEGCLFIYLEILRPFGKVPSVNTEEEKHYIIGKAEDAIIPKIDGLELLGSNSSMEEETQIKTRFLNRAGTISRHRK